MDNNQHDHGSNKNPKPPVTQDEREPMTEGELTELRALIHEAGGDADVDRILAFFKVSRIEDIDYAKATYMLGRRILRIRTRLEEIRISRTMTADDHTINLADLPF